MLKKIQCFWQDRGAATAVEYGLIAGLIAVVIIGALTSIGTSLNTKFGSISDGLK